MEEEEGEALHARWEAGPDCTAAHSRHRISIPTAVHYWPDNITSTNINIDINQYIMWRGILIN